MIKYTFIKKIIILVWRMMVSGQRKQGDRQEAVVTAGSFGNCGDFKPRKAVEIFRFMIHLRVTLT